MVFLHSHSRSSSSMHPKDVLSDNISKHEAAYHLQIQKPIFWIELKKRAKNHEYYSKHKLFQVEYCKADLTLILQGGITVTTCKIYITISRKNFEQNISEQELQTKYIHRHFKCAAGCPGPYIAVVLLKQSDFCLQLWGKNTWFFSPSTMTLSRV